MFAVYNNGNVGFRSTAGNLYELKNVESISPVEFKPEEGFIQEFRLKAKERENQDKKEAINTYKKMANIDVSQEIYHASDIMTRDVFYIDSSLSIQKAYDMLTEHKIEQLPIVSFGKKIVGMIDKKIILNLLMSDLENSKSILNRKIEDVYLPQLITADPITDIRRVAKVMIDFKLHAVPIVSEDGTLVGIISKTDIIKAVSNIPHLQLWS